MFHPITLFIGLRYSWSRKGNGFISFINYFSIAGTFLGVAAMVIVTSVMNGFENELKQRVLGVVPHVVVQSNSGLLENWQQVANSIKDEKEILGKTPFVSSEALAQSNRDLAGVLVSGVDPSQERGLNVVVDNLISGDWSSLQAGRYNLIIGRALAIQLGVGVGDQLRVMVASTSIYTPMGRMPSQRVFNISGIFQLGSELDGSAVFGHLSDVSRVMRISKDNVTGIRLYLNDAFSAPEVAKSIENELASYSVTDWRESQGKLFSAVKMEKNMIATMLILIIAVAAFNIVSALMMQIEEKQGDIGILKTQGMTPSQIQKIFMLNGFNNGVVGTFFGIAIGLLLALNLNSILIGLGVDMMRLSADANLVLPVNVVTSQIIWIGVLSCALSFIATLYPGYRAARVMPAEILRYE